MAAALVLSVLAFLAAPMEPQARRDAVRTAIFYYPWYGLRSRDGSFQHWQQNGARPPRTIASAYYPARGVYSCSDRLVLAAQMAEIRGAGVDQVITSWWGRGSVEDRRLPLVAAAARAQALSLAAHVEPYPGRDAASVAGDLEHLRRHGIRDVYVYGPHEVAAADWAELNGRVWDQRLFAQTGLVGLAAAGGFDGVYTYDVLVFGGGRLARFCEQARRQGLACAPSVGPGYDARRAVGDPRVKPRRRGRTYDSMWAAAVAASPDVVTITSYNEWHEGTQIEPARARQASGGVSYRGYDGAWGRTGAEAERAYLDRTAYWSARFRAAGGPRQ